MSNEVRHAYNYDPVKAHEYYLRTRELKGREKASETTEVSKSSPTSGPSDSRKDKVSNDLEVADDIQASPKAQKTKALKNKGAALRNKLATKAQSATAKKEGYFIAERMKLDKERQAKLDLIPQGPNRNKEILKLIKEYDLKYNQLSSEQEQAMNQPPSPKAKATKKKKKAAVKKLKEKVVAARELTAKAQVKKESTPAKTTDYKEQYEKIKALNYDKMLKAFNSKQKP